MLHKKRGIGNRRLLEKIKAFFTKIPSSNKIQKRIENLESEQAATVREKQDLQKKQKILDIIQQNFTALLNAPQISNNDIHRTVAPPLQH